MNRMAILLAFALLFSTEYASQSQVVKKQVSAAVAYEPVGVLSKKVPPEAYQRLDDEARSAGYALYLSENCPPARRQLLEKMESTIKAEFATVVPQLQRLGDYRDDRGQKRLEMSATVGIDVSSIDALIKQSTASGAVGTPVTAEERAPMVFVFVARKIVGITTSDGKKIKFNKKTTSGDENEGQNAGAAGVSVDYSNEKLVVEEYGGKNIDKAQEIEWASQSVGSVDTAVNETFTQAGYECTDPADVGGFDLAAYRSDYSAGDDVKPETRQAANTVLRENEVGLFATGRMDITLPQKHEVTGLPVVFVKVEAKVTDMTKKLPKTVASVSGAYFQGVGENVEVATQNALLTAARETSAKLVDQLRAKGL